MVPLSVPSRVRGNASSFQDPQGHRWPRLRRVLVVWGGLLGVG